MAPVAYKCSNPHHNLGYCGGFSPRQLLHSTSRGHCRIGSPAKNETQQLRSLSFLWVKKCIRLLEAGVTEVWGQRSQTVRILKMADGEGGRGGVQYRVYTPTPSLTLHHSSPPHSIVQSNSDHCAVFQPLRLGYHDNWVLQLPWLPLVLVVWCVLQFLLAQRVTVWLQGRPCRLRLYSVPWGCRLWA